MGWDAKLRKNSSIRGTFQVPPSATKRRRIRPQGALGRIRQRFVANLALALDCIATLTRAKRRAQRVALVERLAVTPSGTERLKKDSLYHEGKGESPLFP